MQNKYYKLGIEAYRDLKDFSQAAKYFEKAVDDEPENHLAKMYLTLSKAFSSEDYYGQKARSFIERTLYACDNTLTLDVFQALLYDYHVYNSNIVNDWVSDRITYASLDLFSLALDILIDCTQNQLWIYNTYISRVDLDTQPKDDPYQISILKGVSKMYYKLCQSYSYINYSGERTWKSIPGKKSYVKLLKENDEKIQNLDPSYKPLISNGCYIATCVYGAYDCPQVWTLRRYRDNTLKKTALGRIFVKIYYKISPKLVELFGNSKTFKAMFKKRLDHMVSKLQKNGVECTPYQDQ